MKNFHISDILSITTGRLVSSRHIEGVYEILNFLTSDELFTHQLPRACRECEPWLKTQFPQLFPDNQVMAQHLADLDVIVQASRADTASTPESRSRAIDAWVEKVRVSLNLPEALSVYELGADMHTHIDPIEEAQAMVGNKNVIVVEPE
jgi:hypothetical protein